MKRGFNNKIYTFWNELVLLEGRCSEGSMKTVRHSCQAPYDNILQQTQFARQSQDSPRKCWKTSSGTATTLIIRISNPREIMPNLASPGKATSGTPSTPTRSGNFEKTWLGGLESNPRTWPAVQHSTTIIKLKIVAVWAHKSYTGINDRSWCIRNCTPTTMNHNNPRQLTCVVSFPVLPWWCSSNTTATSFWYPSGHLERRRSLSGMLLKTVASPQADSFTGSGHPTELNLNQA